MFRYVSISLLFLFCAPNVLGQPTSQPAQTPEQSFDLAMEVMCQAPVLCSECKEKTGADRQMALAQFITDNVTNPEVVALFEKMTQVSIDDAQDLMKAAIARSKTTRCAFIEDAKTWKVVPEGAEVTPTPSASSSQPVPPKAPAAPASNPPSKSAAAPVKTPPGKPVAPHPAVAVADQILVAIADQNVEGIRAHLNATNQRKIRVERIPRLLKETLKRTGGQRSTTELRGAPRFVKAGSVLAKIRTQGHEVFVIVLTLEDGTYKFEDINSPSIKRFNRQTLIWKK